LLTAGDTTVGLGGGSATLRAGNTTGTNDGGALSLSGGSALGTAGDGGVVNIFGGQGVDAGGAVNINGGDVTGPASGADVIIRGGSGLGGLGEVRLTTTAAATVGQSQALVVFDNNGTGTGGGEEMSLYTGTAAPTHTATAGSLFLRDTGTGAEIYLNTSTGSGTTWSQIQAGSVPTRAFFQDTLANDVTAGNPIAPADMTGAALPAKPLSGFTFNTDAEVYINGVLQFNGAGNDVSNGTGTNINLEGASVFAGDVLTIVYYADI